MLSLVTGVGARGQVGEAVAAALARRGDRVLIVDLEQANAAARAGELVEQGLDVHGYACDLSVAAEVERLAHTVRTAHGHRLDALVNLAGGFGSSGAIAESDPAVLDRMLRINLHTAYLTTRALMPQLMNARGSVVFFASEVVVEGAKTSGVSAYAAAKAAVVALMRSVADEGRSSGVRANALAPAAIRTVTNEASMGSHARYVEREEVAATVAFLCSPASSAISNQIIRLRAMG